MPETSDIEMIWVKIALVFGNLLVGAIYRPPSASTNVIDRLTDYINVHIRNHPFVILAGDFNLPNIDWATQTSNSNDECSRALVDMSFATNLTQLVTEPTRVQSMSSSILDLVLHHRKYAIESHVAMFFLAYPIMGW